MAGVSFETRRLVNDRGRFPPATLLLRGPSNLAPPREAASPAGVLLPAGPASDSRPRGSLREAAQRPHGLHGPVPEVPQRGPYDDVLQVLSGVLGPRPLIGTKADPPPSLCP